MPAPAGIFVRVETVAYAYPARSGMMCTPVSGAHAEERSLNDRASSRDTMDFSSILSTLFSSIVTLLIQMLLSALGLTI